MRLSDLVTGGQDKYSASRITQQPAQSGMQIAAANRQISSMAPGQTLQGEVVYRNGSEVQIKLSDDTVLNAKVDQSINLEVGKNITFEVRGNGGALTLSPLFANTATDVNVLKALGMASLPTNENTVAMTELMMRAGLSVDRSSLQQVFREINAFQGTALSDIVDLHKLGLPVNEGNLEQIASYKNLTHQLVEGMHEVIGSLPETIQNMVQEGDVAGAAKMFQELLQMVEELPQAEEQVVAGGQESSDAAEGSVTAQGQAAEQGQISGQGQIAGQAQVQDRTEISVQAQVLSEIAQDNTETILSLADGKGNAAGGIAETLQPGVEFLVETAEEANGERQVSLPLSEELTKTLEAAGQSPRYEALLDQLTTAEKTGDPAEQARVLQQILQQGIDGNDKPLLEELLKGKQMQKVLHDGLSKLWTIEPKDVAEEGKVEELYQRLDRQLKGLTRMLEQGGATQSASYKAVTNMTQNLDFLQQLNQAYTYVQLPLRLEQGDAHGDLYVYTNKRNLAAKDGQISALLHLDMEHLGPVDVYVAMQSERVNTRFYVADDEMLDFLEAHMDILTERLQKRGYQCSFEMTVREDRAGTSGGLKGILAQENAGDIAIGMYGFDVRA